MTPRSGLLIVGGYGLVGSQTARLLRDRHPGLRLVLAGRAPERGRPLALELGAELVAFDAEHPELGAIEPAPAAILAAARDPHDRLLRAALDARISLADIDRAGPGAALDATIRTSVAGARSPILLSGAWMAGLTALVAAAASRSVAACDRLDIIVQASSADRVGDDGWGFNRRWAWPFQRMDGDERTHVWPLTEPRRILAPDGTVRVSVIIGTLEQISLPLTLGVPTVTTRFVLGSDADALGLLALKRCGGLRLLERPTLGGVRRALLERGGSGDIAGFGVVASGLGGRTRIDVLDVAGQAHLSAIGAAAMAERVLGLDGQRLPAGVSFPEQHARPDADQRLIARAGAVVRGWPAAGAGEAIAHGAEGAEAILADDPASRRRPSAGIVGGGRR